MIRFSWVISLICFLIVFLACGRRTVPEPYDIRVESMPMVQVNRPLFKADQLILSWHIKKSGSKTDGDVSTDTFNIKIYNEINTCYTCERKPLEVITIETRGDQDLITVKNNDSISGTLKYWNLGDIHNLSIEKATTDTWLDKGFLYFTIDYSTVEGSLSTESDAVWPVYARSIPVPEITTSKRLEVTELKGIDSYIEWTLKREVILTKIESNGSTKENEIFYGLNLYKLVQTGDPTGKKLINHKPLMKGHYSFFAGNSRIFASHVDRFGNESGFVAVLLPPPSK